MILTKNALPEQWRTTAFSRRKAVAFPRWLERLNRVYFENRSHVGPQSGKASVTRRLRSELPDYGFQSGRGLGSYCARSRMERRRYSGCDRRWMIGVEDLALRSGLPDAGTPGPSA